MTSKQHEPDTITVRCDLRWLIKRAAIESPTLNTAVQMGLLPLLDTLAARATTIDDHEAGKVLRVLCLTEPSGT